MGFGLEARGVMVRNVELLRFICYIIEESNDATFISIREVIPIIYNLCLYIINYY